MPLPTSDQPWPPTDERIQTALGDWDAWYASEPDRLHDRYANRGVRELPENRPAQYRGGVWGRLARWFWGAPLTPGERRTRLHVPLAGDIARTSSRLLFSEPPQLTAGNAATQARLEQLVAGGLHPTLLEAGELAAALGGVYLRVVWDDQVADRPWISPVAADCVIPDFAYGRLRGATIWTVVATDGHTVWRHLERHERGWILHGLYEGTAGMLGRPVPLQDQEKTAPLAAMVNSEGAIDTGAPKHLTASYMPNVRPARAWRHIPSAAWWGQSDYQGIEPIMDALDETYSSWMRDIRNGKGRVIVPASMLTSNGAGQGASWDQEREIYTGLNIMQRPSDASSKLDVVQFQIRVAEHRDTCRELTDLAVHQAGYSLGTFGADGDGQAVTATEILARNARSMTTRAAKALYGGPAIADALAALLAVEAGARFRVKGLDLEPPKVEFQDSISDSQGELAQTATLLRQAEAASTETLVSMLHPDWDDRQVTAEVDRIQGEKAVADPVLLGAGGHGLTGPSDGPPTAGQNG